MGSRSGIEAGRAFVRMFLDDAEMNARLKGVQARLKATAATMQRTGREMVSMGTKMLLPFIAAMAVFIPFNDRMKEVQAVTQATAAEFDVLNEKAKTLGRTTSFTAAQVAGAMAELGRAGFDPSQIDAAVEHVLNLARASGTELPRAAEIMASTLNQFGLEAKESQRVADTLTASVNSSAIGMEDLAEALKPVAPIAVEAGASLEGTAAAIGLLGNNGIRGSLAGNALARAYKNLSNKATRKELEAIGVSVVDQQGNMRKLTDIIGELGVKTKDLGNADRLAIFEQIFGRGQAAALKLAQAGFDDLLSQISQWDNAAAETAAQMDSGIGGSFRRMMSAIEGVGIALAEAIEGPATEWLDWVGEVSGSVSKFISTNKALVVTIAAVGGGLVLAGGAFLAVAGAIRVVTFAIAAFRTMLVASRAAMVALLAISGPKGWALLAAGVTIAAGSVYALNEAMKEDADAAKQAAKENEEVADKVDKAKAALEGLDAAGPPDVAPKGLQQLQEADAAVTRLAVTMAGLRGETERALRLAAAGNAVKALELLGGDTSKDPADRVREMLEAALSPAEQLKRRLLEVDAAFALLDRPVPAAIQAQVKLGIVDKSTGAISNLRKLRDEIAVLEGRATEAGLKVRDMLAAGVPPELVERYRKLSEIRDQLAEQQKADAAAERQRAREEKQQLNEKRAKADQIRNQNTTAAERIDIELAELESLRAAVDPDTQTPLLDEETYRRELERLHQRQIELAGNDVQRITSPQFSGTDLRSQAGGDLIADLINGRTDVNEQQLRQLEEFNGHMRELVELTETRQLIKKATF